MDQAVEKTVCVVTESSRKGTSLRGCLVLSAAVAVICVGTGGCGGGNGSPERSRDAAVPGASSERSGSTDGAGVGRTQSTGTADAPSTGIVKVLLGEKCRKGCLGLVVKFDTCLLRNDIEIPHPHSALLSDTNGVKTGSPRVRDMVSECRRELLGASAG